MREKESASLFCCQKEERILITPSLQSAFEALSLSPSTLRAIDDMGYTTPTEIQSRVIPLLLEGKDVIGQAQTGTGKTAAFGIPMMERLDPSRPEVQGLVLAPTRELAVQIAGELSKLARYSGHKHALLYGGSRYGAQFRDLDGGVQIVVGTPGRILDHINRGTLRLNAVRFLVLDEADRMLDMGFLPDVERILRRTPRQRQTALFSATVPQIIRIMARRHMYQAVSVAVNPEQATVEEIEQVYYEVADRDKVDGLLEVLKTGGPERAIVFCRTKAAVDRLTRTLGRRGHHVEALHGDMPQRSREDVMARFREGGIRLLIATDVAARGLDVPEVSHVVNFDIPEESEAYVHRIGRTGRMGRAGKAITFVAEWDHDFLANIKKVTNGSLREERLGLYT
jgi:ATP-dependent RNA helicase DeaD